MFEKEITHNSNSSKLLSEHRGFEDSERALELYRTKQVDSSRVLCPALHLQSIRNRREA